jgi:hypothetical protein
MKSIACFLHETNRLGDGAWRRCSRCKWIGSGKVRTSKYSELAKYLTCLSESGPELHSLNHDLAIE